MSIKNVMATLSLCLLSAIAAPQASAGISYEVVDVADTTPPVNRFKFIYHLDGAFDQFAGFNLLYDRALYANVNLTQALGLDWFLNTVEQPDPGLGVDGIVSYMALVTIADASATFEVDYDYLGTGLPGSQPYELFNADLTLFTPLRTTPFGAVAVPEPATPALILAGLALLSLRPARRRMTTLPART